MRDNMTTHAPKKFIFEADFSADSDQSVSAPRLQRLFTRQDVEKIRQECFEKGQTTALVRAQELIVQAQDALSHAEEARIHQEQLRVAAEHARHAAEQRTLEAVEALIQHSQSAFSDLAEISQAHWKQAAELALVCARQIAGEALRSFPQGAILAAMGALATEIQSQPRLTVRAGADWAPGFQTALDQKARALGLPCQIQVTADPDMPLAGFDFNWGDGRAQFDPQSAADKIGAALRAALANAQTLTPNPTPVRPQNGA
jgi:flagellar assembly protein FliH